MLPGIVNTLVVNEPRLARSAPRTLAEAVVEPFHEFITRSGWRQALLVLGFIFLYKLGDSMATALATPFYLDIGFTMSEIGLIAKNAGLWASVFGGLLGGIWMLRIGINRGLWLFGAVQVFSILGFAWLAHVNQPDRLLLAGVIAFEALGGLAPRISPHSSRESPTALHGDTVRAVHESRRRAAFADQCDDCGIVDAIGWFDFICCA